MEATAQQRPHARPSAPRAAAADVSILLALAIVVGGCLIVAWEARHSTFTADDWAFVLARRGWTAQAILGTSNEHLAALPILAFKLLLALFGLGSYAPFATLLIVCHGLACFALWALTRRYVGPWVALAPAAVLATLGPAWHVLLFYASITFVGAVAAGLGMALCLERRDRRGDVGAGILLGVSLLTSSVGLAMVVLAAVLIVLQRPTRWRRLWAVAIPVSFYLAWYAGYGVSSVKTANLAHIPHYVFLAAAAAFASITGLGQTHVSPYLVSTTYGKWVLVAAALVFAFRLIRGLRPPPLTWATLAALVTLWIGEALEYFPGGREANQSRYQYAASALLLLIAATAAKGWRPGVRSRIALAAVTLFACGANLVILDDRAGFWTANGNYARAETGALQAARGIVSPDFVPENIYNIALMGDHNLTPITAGPYFSAVDEWGSSADTPREILGRPEYAREAADLVVATAEDLGPVPVSAATASGTCRVIGHGGTVLKLPPGTQVTVKAVQRPTQIALRRFASSFRFVHWTVPSDSAVQLRVPTDRASLPWYLGVGGVVGTRTCTSP
jgi:hypothetical protein